MAFEVKARILLELGAELISSDAIALYELIKNSIDAGSRKTEVSVVVILKHSAYVRLSSLLKQKIDKKEFISEVTKALEISAGESRRTKFIETLEASHGISGMRTALDLAYQQGNRLRVRDNGHGMALSELKDVYLTVGTTTRLKEKQRLFSNLVEEEKDPRKIPLGEKGIGRLAAMRLGDILHVRTARKTDARWSILNVNWASIREDIDQDLASFPAEPRRGSEKESDSEYGTSVTVRNLLSDWSREKLAELANTEFSKLFDPFEKGVRKDDVRLSFNGEEVYPPAFEHDLLDVADACCSGEFQYMDGVPVLSGKVSYTLRKREKTFHVRDEALQSILQDETQRPRSRQGDEEHQKALAPEDDEILDALKTLGAFKWNFYWYNRGRFQREQGDLWHSKLRRFVSQWSGGLLVYRDGYRVYPYGAPDDDWLDLDRRALSASAYKLNRSQIVGRLQISSRQNPRLQDQTNREGFRDCPEKHALVRMLRHVFITEVRTFLERVNDENKAIDRDDLQNIERRLESSQKEAIRRIREIGRKVPDEKQTINQLLDYLKDVSLAWERAKEVARTFESELEKYLHLAGVGLMVEFIAHELTRATQGALKTLEGKQVPNKSEELGATLETLRAQLKTIEKRLRVLDPMSIPGRQRKGDYDLKKIVEEVFDAHAAQIQRHKIKVRIDGENFSHRVEHGQIVQIFENLISNSVFWLRQRKLRDSTFAPTISVNFDKRERKITFSDNGPGIPRERGDEIFAPFFTTKPPGKGRGLGLYISQRLSEYNDATLTLDEPTKSGIHHGFVLKFKDR